MRLGKRSRTGCKRSSSRCDAGTGSQAAWQPGFLRSAVPFCSLFDWSSLQWRETSTLSSRSKQLGDENMTTLVETFSLKGRTIETTAAYVQQFVDEHYQQVLQHHRQELEELFARVSEPAYARYSQALFLPVSDELKQAGLICDPAFPGTFPSHENNGDRRRSANVASGVCCTSTRQRIWEHWLRPSSMTIPGSAFLADQSCWRLR